MASRTVGFRRLEDLLAVELLVGERILVFRRGNEAFAKISHERIGAHAHRGSVDGVIPQAVEHEAGFDSVRERRALPLPAVGSERVHSTCQHRCLARSTVDGLVVRKRRREARERRARGEVPESPILLLSFAPHVSVVATVRVTTRTTHSFAHHVVRRVEEEPATEREIVGSGRHTQSRDCKGSPRGDLVLERALIDVDDLASIRALAVGFEADRNDVVGGPAINPRDVLIVRESYAARCAAVRREMNARDRRGARTSQSIIAIGKRRRCDGHCVELDERVMPLARDEQLMRLRAIDHGSWLIEQIGHACRDRAGLVPRTRLFEELVFRKLSVRAPSARRNQRSVGRRQENVDGCIPLP